MPSHLYRFRPLDRLLDKGELLNQEIYFASPAELNDPMEGFRDVVWQGDAVLWSNLFRHYVQCLEWACALLVIGGEDRPITWDNIPVVNRGDISPTPQHAAKLKKIVEQILGDADMQAVIAALASRTIPVRRSELTALLDILHLFALAVIDRVYPRSGAVQDSADLAALREALRQARLMVENAAKLEAQTPNPELVLSALFDAQAHTFAEMHFIHCYNGAILPNQRNRNFVFLSFPDEYVRQVEALVYPPWYAACFMQQCSNPAIWGTYGDGHRNVCLKFKVRDKGGLPTLRLYGKVGWSSTRGDMLGWADHELHPIAYDRTPGPVSFFRELGRIPEGTIRDYWYTDRQGNRSTVAHSMQSDEDGWRQRYWQEFKTGITTKLADWRHEREYRLLLVPLLTGLSTSAARTVHYDFPDLEGIIFGVRTPVDRKMQICKIIEEKCRAEQRADFSFYQAELSPETGLVAHRKMGLLRFAADASPAVP